MARRRGSGRGKSTVNSRKSALENERLKERLKDDPGGTRAAQHNHHSNMEAATTTTTTTTKTISNKNKQLLNNHRSLDRRGASATAATTTTTSSNHAGPSTTTTAGTNHHKKHTNNSSLQKTYRIASETHGAGGGGSGDHHHHPVKTPKLTAKQSKAAAKAAAAAAVAAAAESAANERERRNSDKLDPLATSVVEPKASSTSSTSKHVSPTHKKEKLEQKTATTNASIASPATATAPTATTKSPNNSNNNSNNNNSNNNNKNSSSSDNSSNNKFNTKNYSLSFSDGCSKNSNNKTSSNNNNSNSKNNSSHNNAKSDTNNTSSSNVTTTTTTEAASSPAPPATPSNSETATTAAAVVAVAASTTNTAAVATWNTSKYLHKKFKRLASTTENDADNANKLRTTSMSSASSASPPPPVVDVAARLQHSEQQAATALLNGHQSSSPKEQQQQQQQQQQHHPQSQHVAANISQKVPIIDCKPNELPQKLTAGVTNALSNIVDKNTLLINVNNHSNNNNNNNNNNIKFPSSANNSNKRTINIHSVVVIRSATTPPTTASPAPAPPPPPPEPPTPQPTTVDSINLQPHLQHLQPHPECSPSYAPTHAVQQPQNTSQPQQIPTTASSAAEQSGSITGRHVCPFCNLNCTKPSVLQKHIRAHTNERPYPCDICGFAFKTKSNYYKHCRSRTHAARKRGIELPPDVDDGSFAGSDQEHDPDSNSSSDVISRTASPFDESSVSLPAVPYHQLHQHPLHQQQLSPATIASPTPSPSSLSSAKSAYLQQPAQQQQQQLPLGSPAAGTLPPSTASIAGSTKPIVVTATTAAAAQKQSIDYKPYKPKFHKAALYATAKEVALQPEQQFQQQPAPQKQAATTAQQNPQYHHPSLSPSTQVKLNNHINTHQLQLQMQQQQLHQLHPQQQHLQQQHLHQQHPQQQHPQQQHPQQQHPKQQHPQQQQPHPQQQHPQQQHPQQQHPQQQHLQQQHPQQQHTQQLSISAINAAGLPLAAQSLPAPGVYYLAQAPSAPQASAPVATPPLLHSSAHIPQPYYSPVAAAAAAAVHQQAMVAFQMMTPQQQQQFHHQVQLQQHMQQQQQLQMQQQQQQHSPALAKPHQQQRQAPANMPAAPPPTTTLSTPQQSPLQFLANAATSISNVGSTNPSTLNSSSGNSNSTSAPTSTNSGLIHGNISAVAAAASSGGVQLNKEFLTEHITKLISQNEAIVDNKELLLQKKYPKTLNRSRSFNNTNNNSNTANNIVASSAISTSNNNNINVSTYNNNNTNNNLVISTAIVAESANAKLAQAIVSKQQLQQQQQQQHQLQLQLQKHQHYQHMQQQALQQQQLQKQRLDEQQQQQQPVPLNGISKHISTAKSAQQQYRPQQQHQSQQQQAPMSLQLQAQHFLKETTSLPPQQAAVAAASSGNLPLNLSAKAKPIATSEEHQIVTSVATATTPNNTPSSTPRKRQSIEHQASSSSDASISSSAKQAPPNNSIIKNLLLNARGLAVPTGEGEDAVYTCPLCLLQFRTAEDLQLHNSTYCQGASCSAPISPVTSPSYKYFRSNSISLNLPDLKNSLYLSQNPLSLASLAKVAWSQLKTKPSCLVLSQLSGTHVKPTTSTTSSTTATTTTAITTTTVIASNSVPSSTSSNAVTAADYTLRLIDAPLPSPGPLLGKTPLVDSYNHHDGRKSEDVIITKMHDDRQFPSCSNTEAAPCKRPRYDLNDHLQLYPVPGKQQSLRQINTSGGDMQLLNVSVSPFPSTDGRKEEQRMKRFNSSGGCMIPISECTDIDMSPKMIRTTLLSGGSFQEVSPKSKEKDPPTVLNITSKISGLNLPAAAGAPQHFQFPPINSITAFNPLTLPPMASIGGENRVIPYVPGIPGPNCLTPQLPPPQQLQMPLSAAHRALSPNHKKTPSPMTGQPEFGARLLSSDANALPPFVGLHNVPSEFNRMPPSPALRSVRNWVAQNTSGKQQYTSLNSLETPKKSFNFQRIADNLSPRKPTAITVVPPPNTSPDVRHFNFDNLNKQTEASPNRGAATLAPLHVDTSTANTAPTSANPVVASEEMSASKKSRFLRPTSLPLKPGTFTPKRHHGITPNANTLPLISPETPRPSKACVQLYLNGHAYTYLGLKCSTKVFYCTVNLPQPSYVADNHKLSMYSVWQVRAENNPYPLGLKPKLVMSLYDSRQKSLGGCTMAGISKLEYNVVVSQQAVMTPFLNNQGQFYHHQLKQIAATSSVSEQLAKEASDISAEKRDKRDSDLAASSASSSCSSLHQQQQPLVGGYESHEDYTYIRGRGRGRYVCSECGIRCKKPSMLKKHIRTHTDVRPYTCKNCNFSFKTKGNLTKHMQSKTHYRKCIELGINPGPMPADGEFLEPDMEFDQQSSTSAGGRTSSLPGESDSDDFSEAESESSDTDDAKSRLQEHEAARCLLSLSMTPPIGQTTAASPQLKNTDIYTYQQALGISAATTASTGIITITSTSTNNVSSAASALATLTQQPSSSCSVKRVVTSFTSPKPPFDYQKQEQYYSNPEESKPKRSANASAALCFESTPIDLTKPRSVDVISTAPKQSLPIISSNSEPSPNGNPLKTQAQIRDIIFGTTSNESGFLKTVISVSDKVRNSANSEIAIESPKKLNENVLLQAYLTEQALQYTKIKQCQMNRSFLDATSGIQGGTGTSTMTLAGATFPATGTTTPNMAFTNSVWNKTNTATSVATTTSSSAVVASSVVSGSLDATTACKEIHHITIAPAVESERNQGCKKSGDAKTNEHKFDSIPDSTPHPPKLLTPSDGAQAAWKSSDEGEESECPSDQEPVLPTAQPTTATSGSTSNATGTSSKDTSAPSSHNANLPAAVQQPGTTDFSGVLSAPARTVIVGEDGFKKSTNNEILPVYPRTSITTDGRPICTICSKSFQKQHQLVLHMNIHYMERKFKCESCGVSFRTQGHLQKHERSEAHKNKVMMTSTFGVPTTSNPRPFECTDCKIAFRIHGHLAKHLRSKTHVQKLECLQKLPFGTYAEIERAGISLTEIDTSDCENSLISLKLLAQKLIEKDPSKLSSYTTPSGMQALNDANSNAGMTCQDSASEDGFSAAASAAATAIASLDNDSATNTPRRGNSLSEEETTSTVGHNSLKRRPPATTAGSFSNGEESDNQAEAEKRPRLDLGASAASPAPSTTSNTSN